ncbi:molybdopterin-dependent oxidoreductase [Salipiger sp. 1_MG-2023]|uniref:molybdopterin-dependent oxidoreductase n=1 Tax=Salipiger sp. 1_MG-2023 TaxID=3062665 RepID=UPI0026E3763A|nr:molybdopterin-dependent oxidoreductase [Salipiger sp. 1_MG-2023]MDO6587412.1 molybdopterin-dependent oxidoreductase [Salipiger sp. 1_MG-2023]
MVATHWGTYRAVMENGRLLRLDPIAEDPAPSPLAAGMIEALDAPVRIRRPAIRKSFLAAREAGKIVTEGAGRGYEPFVELPWDEALDLAAAEIDRVRSAHGNSSVYGGSYGWASAGRFHHAQSQIHRFLNSIGGYTRSVQNYSYAAADTIVPYILGDKSGLVSGHTPWDRIAEHTDILVAFGGLPSRNSQVSSGGISRHILPGSLSRLSARGGKVISVSPIRDDTDPSISSWMPIRPGTDTALMLGLASHLLATDRADRSFLASHTEGFAALEAYITGHSDGVAKTPDWAAEITGVGAEEIRGLAERMAETRCFVMVAWSLQRAEGGEQPYWMAVALASILGQVGQPGGGFGFGYGSVNGIGNSRAAFSFPSLPQLSNGVEEYIPVARIADALLNPGETYPFNGENRTYPDLRLVYWAGGNPFHHHQDLNRLRRAWQRPEAVIVHDSWWNPLARHADIVFPVTSQLERNDIAFSSRDHFVTPSHAVAVPAGEARDDYEVFSALSKRLSAEDTFTAGRDVESWLRHIYEGGRDAAAAAGYSLPDFEAFWQAGMQDLPVRDGGESDLLAAFCANPDAAALGTPSGRIELFSQQIATYGYADCPPHPAWLPPDEWLGAEAAGRHPLHLISNQPKTRLHSQYDFAGISRAAKRSGREPMRMHPDDAAARGLASGDIVRVFNDRGACLAALETCDALLPGVVQLSTGAWFDPSPAMPSDGGLPLERHGNPNVLSQDKGASSLSQAPSAQSCLVDVEAFSGPQLPVEAFDPQHIVPRG